ILGSTGMKRLKGTRITWSRRMIALQLKIPMIRGPHPYYVVVRQLEASRSYDCMDRLGEIHVPTLILHGKKDKSAPMSWPKPCIAGSRVRKCSPFLAAIYFSF